MITPSDRVRKTVSVGLSLLLLTLSAAVPLMERSELVHAPAVEAEHGPGECPVGHDHTVCTQVGANLSVAVETQDPSLGGSVEATAVFASLSELPSAGRDGANRSRAPPLG